MPARASTTAPLRPVSLAFFTMQSTVQTVTPNQARDLLQANTSNRPLSRFNLAFFEGQLTRGEWKLTHQGIAISDTGRLLDGQHRLAAIANTGISAPLLVTSGLPDDVFSVIDTGKTRSGSDALGIAGAKNCSVIACAIKLFLLQQLVPGYVWIGGTAKRLVSNESILDCYTADRSQWDELARIASTFKTNRVLIPGPFASVAMVALDKGICINDIIAIAEKIHIGANLIYGDPALAYRNKCHSTSAPAQQGRVADYIKLFNACLSGQSLKIFKSQSYPPMPQLRPGVAEQEAE